MLTFSARTENNQTLCSILQQHSCVARRMFSALEGVSELRTDVWCDVIKVKMSLTGSLAFCAKTAKVDSLLHRHLVWETAGDGSVWQLSASQFSSPVSLLIGYSDDTQTHTHKEKWINETYRERTIGPLLEWWIDCNYANYILSMTIPTPNPLSLNGPQV